jgi:hypothetical protein
MNHDDLAAGCQSFDGAKEVHRANERIPRTTGGRGGIRTLEAVLPPTRFPVARTRPGYATLPWRRGWDSNPRRLITSPLFESGTFNHSDTSPTREVYQRSRVIRRRNGERNSKTARQLPGGLSWYAWQDSNLRPLGPQPNALSPELQARIDHFTPMMQRSALGGSSGAGREGFEPSERFFSAQPLSRRPHSTTLAPPQVALSTAGQGRRVHRKPDGKVYHGAGSRPRFNRPSRRGKTPP